MNHNLTIFNWLNFKIKLFFLTDYFYFKINLRGLRVCTPSAQNVNIIKLNLSKSY